jgi:hypothetical protein
VTVTADDLDQAISSVVSVLGPAASQDWSRPAGTLDWDCWHTAEHVGDCLLSYAAQLAARPGARYVRFLASADQDASPAHPSGLADPEGFAAMGCVETLLHGHDIAQRLGRTDLTRWGRRRSRGGAASAPRGPAPSISRGPRDC